MPRSDQPRRLSRAVLCRCHRPNPLDPLIVTVASLVGTTGPPTRAENVVIILQSRADLNPHSSELRKLAIRDIAKSLTNDICAGQGRSRCVRGGLEHGNRSPRIGEIHGIKVTSGVCAAGYPAACSICFRRADDGAAVRVPGIA
jgi:hypothetical protein